MHRSEETAPIRQSVVVDCPIEDAFELFTEHFGEWWPLASHSAGGEETETCVIEPREGGRIYERSKSGDERDWGAVIDWDPPRHVSFTWHRDGFVDEDQRVEVEFTAVADGTRVTVTHAGWQNAGIPVASCFASFACQMLVAA